MPELHLENISKYFGKTKAVSDITLKIKDGTFCVVLGPSGCGKSTLLNLIAGLEEATTGKIFLDDKDITELPPQRRNIAMVFQTYALYPHLTVFENIAFGLHIRGEKKKEIKNKVLNISRTLNIEDKLNRFPRELSGGERQRVATGRAIVRDPALFLFDEPLSNLDARLRIELRSEFIKLHRRLKKSIIYVTHDQLEAMSLGQEIVVLKDGSIVQVSPPHELYNDPQNLFVAEFVGSPPMNIISLEVKELNNSIKLVKEEFALEVPDALKRPLKGYIGQNISFGFRPTAAKLTQKGQIRGEIVFTETVGEDDYARIKINSLLEINVRIGEFIMPRAQELVSIALDFDRCYLFDSEGRRIK